MICNLDKKLFQVQRQSASLEPHGNEYWSIWKKGGVRREPIFFSSTFQTPRYQIENK